MITPDDIRNGRKASGFDNVNKHPDEKRVKRFRAQVYAAAAERKANPDAFNAAGHKYLGPWRQFALHAAQDYCDYANSGKVVRGPALRSAGHKGKRDPIKDDPEVRHALGVLRDARGQREGKQGYVYLIVEDLPGDGLRYGKVGYSTNPQARVAELQTGNPRKLKLLYAKAGSVEDEARLHAKYQRDNVLQEWFLISKELVLEFPPHTATGRTPT